MRKPVLVWTDGGGALFPSPARLRDEQRSVTTTLNNWTITRIKKLITSEPFLDLLLLLLLLLRKSNYGLQKDCKDTGTQYNMRSMKKGIAE